MGRGPGFVTASGKLVGFLGIGPKSGYSKTCYQFEGRTSRETRFVSLGLAELVGVSRVTLFSTPESRKLYEEELQKEALSFGVEVSFPDFPLGQSREELQEQIRALVPELLDSQAKPLYLDITHGFRSFPFFASSLMAFASSLSPSLSSFHVVYGAFEATGPGTACPIWDLSPTLAAYQQGFSLSTFLRSGRLDSDISQRLNVLSKDLRKVDSPSADLLASFGKALRHFADDFATIRVGPLLLGPSKDKSGSAVALRNALHESRAAVAKYLPMLDPVMDQIEEMIAPLTHKNAIPDLACPRGLRCTLELAKLYESCERYSECAVVLREMATDLYATSAASSPGYANFDSRQRTEALGRLRDNDRHFLGKLKSIRDDIQHGGYDDAAHLKRPDRLRRTLRELRTEMEARVQRKETDEAKEG